MKIDDKVSIVIVEILEVVFTDGLIGEFLGDFEVREGLWFIVLDNLNGVISIFLVDIVGFRLEAKFLLHPR